VNKKLIMKTAGALMAATTTFGMAAPAMAQDGGSNGVGSGNNVTIDLGIPVLICGIGAAVLGGDALGTCPTTREAQAPEGSGQTASAANTASAPSSASGSGLLSGNNVNVNANVPVTVCGAGVGVAGDAQGNCPPAGPAAPAPASAPQSAPQAASGHGVLTGNNINVDARIPVLVCGIVAVLLGGDAAALCGS
jgi:hypothetical protein